MGGDALQSLRTSKHAEPVSLWWGKKSSTTAGNAELSPCKKASSAHAHIYCRSTKARQKNCIIMQMSDKASASFVGCSLSTQPGVIHSLLWTLAECPKSRAWTHLCLPWDVFLLSPFAPRSRQTFRLQKQLPEPSDPHGPAGRSQKWNFNSS